MVAATCLIQVGCIGLSREHAVGRWGIRAKLVDAADSTPVARREVVVVTDKNASAVRTDRNATIRTVSHTFPYWTWLGGPAVASKPVADISISATGYQLYSIHWNDLNPKNSNEVRVIRPFIGRPYLDLGVIKLNKGKQ